MLKTTTELVYMVAPAHVCLSKEVSGCLIHLNVIVDQYSMLDCYYNHDQEANTVVASHRLHFEYKRIVIYVINQIQTIKDW